MDWTVANWSWGIKYQQPETARYYSWLKFPQTRYICDTTQPLSALHYPLPSLAPPLPQPQYPLLFFYFNAFHLTASRKKKHISWEAFQNRVALYGINSLFLFCSFVRCLLVASSYFSKYPLFSDCMLVYSTTISCPRTRYTHPTWRTE